MTQAVVRPPGERFVEALSEQMLRPAIDITLAKQQHAEYCAALRTAGLELVELPPDEDHPDGCFVQDTAVIWGGLVVLARFGVVSRQGEQAAIRKALQGHGRLFEIQPPATLEGGDVLVVGSRLFVGRSARTNRAGFAQLRELLELEGASVESLVVRQGLHLLSGCAHLGRGVLLATDLYADLPVFAGLDVIRVPAEEAYAANALGVGQYVLFPAGYPRTSSEITARGFEVLPLPMSEFAKADGGITCLSLLFS